MLNKEAKRLVLTKKNTKTHEESLLNELLKRDVREIDIATDLFEVVRLVEKENFDHAHTVNKFIKFEFFSI